MPSQDHIPYSELPDNLGINPGENLMVASDLTRLAANALRMEGGFDPDRLLDSFLRVLGPTGTLIIPSFNFNLRSGDPYNPSENIPITGALAETALKRKDFLRTKHPLHSFLVSGKNAPKLAGMNNISSFGPDSPFAFFHEKDVLMLMIGSNVTEAFTFVHYVEEMEKVRYRKYEKLTIRYTYPEGDKDWKEALLFAKKPGWTMNLASLEKIFRDKGILKESSFNGVPCAQVRLGEAFPIIRDDILHNNAKSISRFSMKLFAREKLKKTLSSLHLYRTLSEKISHGPGPR